MKPVFDHWPPMKSIDKWPHWPQPDVRFDPEPDFTKIEAAVKKVQDDFQASLQKPLPPRYDPGFIMVPVVCGAVACIAVLIMLARCIKGTASRTRRGRVVGAAALQQGTLRIFTDQPSILYNPRRPERGGRVVGAGAVPQSRRNISTDQPSIPNNPRRPSEQTEPGRPPNNDLPPSYCVSDEPPPYTYSKDAEPEVHTRRQNALIEKGLRADAVAMTTTSNNSEAVTPGMKTELVFDNGRIVERLSLDLNSNNKETRVASNNNVEQQSTRHANVKDRVVYVDETDDVKVNTQ